MNDLIPLIGMLFISAVLLACGAVMAAGAYLIINM
jgi:hypothetical protein